MLELRSSKVNQNRKHTLWLTERKKAVHTLSINQGRVISCAVKCIVPQWFQITPNGKYFVHTNGIVLSRILHLITLNHRPIFLVSPTTKDPAKRKGKNKK
jgi:hypothetical protein